MSEHRYQQPPKAPQPQRRITLHRHQWVGVPLLMLPMLLAVAGVLGESRERAVVRTGALDVVVEWPSRFRYKQIDAIRITIANRTGAVGDTVEVELDTAYVGHFSTVRAIPSFERPYTLGVAGPQPGTTARVIIELQAERYGRHDGMLTLGTAGDTARVPIHTTIFP